MKLPLSQFREAINQCINKSNLILGGEFEYSTAEEKQIELEEEHRMIFPEEYK